MRRKVAERRADEAAAVDQMGSFFPVRPALACDHFSFWRGGGERRIAGVNDVDDMSQQTFGTAAGQAGMVADLS